MFSDVRQLNQAAGTLRLYRPCRTEVCPYGLQARERGQRVHIHTGGAGGVLTACEAA